MARKIILVSDISGSEINGDYARVVVDFPNDKRKGRYVLDAMSSEVEAFVKVGKHERTKGRRAAAVPA